MRHLLFSHANVVVFLLFWKIIESCTDNIDIDLINIG